jgi:hypothetical protein
MARFGLLVREEYWMLSPDKIAEITLYAGLLSPLVVMMVPNSRWLLRVFPPATMLVGAAVWEVGNAVDAEAAKPNENLDVQLGYAVDFWMVMLGGSLFAASAAIKAGWFYVRNKE